jgi:hypothetical protein
MHLDPRFQSPADLDAMAHRVKERRGATGFGSMPTFLLMVLLPFLLMVRALLWAWSRLKREN